MLTAGLQTGTRYNSVPLAGTTTFARNTLLRTGSFDIYNPNSKGEGSIWVFADNGPITQGNVVFEDILFLFFFLISLLYSCSAITSL